MKLENVLESVEPHDKRRYLELQAELIEKLPDIFDIQISKDFRILVKGPDVPAFAIKNSFSGGSDFWEIGRTAVPVRNLHELVLETYYVRAMRKAILAAGFYKDRYIENDAETTYLPGDELSKKLPDSYRIGLLDNGSCWCGYFDNAKGKQVGTNFTPPDNPSDFEKLKTYLQQLGAST